MKAQGLRRLLAMLLLMPSLAFATLKETVAVESLGTGKSRDEAVAAALAGAVGQVQGQHIPRNVLSRIFLDSIRAERMVRMNVLNDYRVRSTRLSPAVAFVQDYQVLESGRGKKDKHWTARVQAEVVSPEARLAKRREQIKLVVLPFYFMLNDEAEVTNSDGQRLMQKTLKDIDNFQALVTGKLGNERVAAQPLPATATEKFSNAVESPGDIDWRALAELTGAGHFVTVQVEEFRLEEIEMRRGVFTGRLDGKFVFNYRLIRTTGGQPEIVQSGTFKTDVHEPALRALSMGGSQQRVSDNEVQGRIKRFYDKAAQLFSRELLAELVPPDVIAREGDNVLLQSGGAPLRKGDKLAVLGPDLIEPDAIPSLMARQDGIRIAVLEVTSTEGERVVARVLKGNAYGVQPGSMLRRITGLVAEAAPAPQPVSVLPEDARADIGNP